MSANRALSRLHTFHIPPTTAVHPFGDFNSKNPLFSQLSWTIKEHERWAIVGGGRSRKTLIEILLAQHRLSPPVGPPGRHPFLYDHPESSSSLIHHLTFSVPPSPNGEFSDYTARYHTLQESDRLTLLKKMLFVLDPDPLNGGKKGEEKAREVARVVGVEHLLDVPFVGLSNGQTRRARMALALLLDPKFLVIEEPFAGLDPAGRQDISHVIERLQERTRVVLVVRGGENVPIWITHVAESPSPGQLRMGRRGEEQAWWNERMERIQSELGDLGQVRSGEQREEGRGKEVARLEGVDISYGSKKVLDGVHWSIKTGERWHLQGPNGSGKTTLLSLILGDHPRSFALPPHSLQLFGKPRRGTPTPTLSSLIGHTSPEIFKSFPRSGGMSILDAIGTGFLGIYSRRDLSPAQTRRIHTLLQSFFPTQDPAELGKQKFSEQNPSAQCLLLFLRAVVGEPELLVLDEPFAFMEQDGIERCRLYLEGLGGKTAVIWVGHWEGERPWKEERGRVARLQGGRVVLND